MTQQDFYLMISIFTLQLCHLLFYFVRCVLLMKKKVKTVRDSKFYPRWVKHLCRKPDVPASAAHLTPCSQAAYKKTTKKNKTWGSAGSWSWCLDVDKRSDFTTLCHIGAGFSKLSEMQKKSGLFHFWGTYKWSDDLVKDYLISSDLNTTQTSALLQR